VVEGEEIIDLVPGPNQSGFTPSSPPTQVCVEIGVHVGSQVESAHTLDAGTFAYKTIGPIGPDEKLTTDPPMLPGLAIFGGRSYSIVSDRGRPSSRNPAFPARQGRDR
jgi:hypothetical protein